jgi:predicted nucleic acid-binding protein
MMFLLDTNVISELRKAKTPRIDRRVAIWARRTPPQSMFLSVMTILELETGILLAGRRDPMQARSLREWLDNLVLPRFEGRILPVTIDIAQRCSPMHVPDPRPIHDSLIAATALVLGMTLATRNVRDFQPMGVAIVNPWET